MCYGYGNWNGNWNGNSRLNHSYIKEQKQISKQTVTMHQDQALSNDIFARLLSVAENYAMRTKKNTKSSQKYNEQFGYYDTFNSGKNKNLNELKTQFLFEIEVFKISYQDFCKNYKNYQYPNNYDKSKTISFLNKLSQMVNESDKKYYDSIIQLLNHGNTKSYENEIRESEKNKANKGKVDPKLLMNAFPLIQNVGEDIKKNVEDNVLKNGKHEVNLVIGGKNNDDKKLKRINVKLNENLKKNGNDIKKKDEKKGKENKVKKKELKKVINELCYIYNNNSKDFNKININVYNDNTFKGELSYINIDISNLKKIIIEIEKYNRNKITINGSVDKSIIKGVLNLYHNEKTKKIEIKYEKKNYYNYYNYSFTGTIIDTSEENLL